MVVPQQPDGAVHAVQKVAIMMGVPLNLLQKNCDVSQQLGECTHSGCHNDMLTSSPAMPKGQAQTPSETPSRDAFDDPSLGFVGTIFHD